MNKSVEDLDRRLREIDRATAEHVERLVREALALAGEGNRSSGSHWPSGYFERTAGSLAGETFERGAQSPFPARESF